MRSTRFRTPLAGVLALCAAQLLTATPARAAPAQAEGQAIVLRQLSFLKDEDLDFGEIVPAAAQAFVTLSPDGTRSSTGAIVLVGNTHQPARFTGKGTVNQTVLISLGSSTINLTGPGTAMRVDQFIIGSTPTATLTTSPTRFRITNSTGVFNFPIGARLRVNANQAPGTYAGTFSVTLVYE